MYLTGCITRNSNTTATTSHAAVLDSLQTGQRAKHTSEMFIGMTDWLASDSYVAWDSGSGYSLCVPHLPSLSSSRAVSFPVAKYQDWSGPWDLIIPADTSLKGSRASLGLRQSTLVPRHSSGISTGLGMVPAMQLDL